MPTFNMQELISESIDSVLSQTYKNWELIIVDDCSTDATPEVVRRYVSSDARIRSLRTNENTNLPGSARNIGIALAKGKYIAFLDHDDIWRQIKLERQLRVFSLDESVDLVHSHLMGVSGSKLTSLRTMSNPFRRRATRASLSKSNVIQCSSVIAKASIIKDLGGFSEDPGLRAVEDYDLWVRIMSQGSIAFVSENHGRYRIAIGGTLLNTNLSEIFQNFAAKNGVHLAGYSRSKVRERSATFFDFPLSVYAYFIDGEFRIRTRRNPRIWK
jgi:glycosyltransferase involved in cell wall biosynthesis